MMSFQNFLLFAGCSMFSLYIFPVGGVQIAHVLLAMAACVALSNERIRFTSHAILLLLLAAVSFAREAFAVLAGAPTNVLFQPLFILFNLTTFVAVFTIYFHSRSTASYRWGITLAVAIAVASLLVTGVKLTDSVGVNLTGDRIAQRAIGSFQNPNQLAYFAAIAFSITALLYTFERISLAMTIVLIPAIFLLAMASQSKSGIIGLLLGLTALLAGSASSRIWAGILAVALALAWVFGSLDLNQLLVVERLQGIGSDSDDNLAARGYFLLIDNAQTAVDVLFGLGANGVKSVLGNEIHSTYMAFFVMYGVLGGSLYIAFIVLWLGALYQVVPFTRFLAVAGPPMLYGIAHNGTRFSIFYAMIALSLALCEERRMSLRQTRPEPVPAWMLPSALIWSGRTDVADRASREGHKI